MTVKDKWSTALNESLHEEHNQIRRTPVKKGMIKYTIIFKSGATISSQCRSITVETNYNGTAIRSLTIVNTNNKPEECIEYLDYSEIAAVIKEEVND